MVKACRIYDRKINIEKRQRQTKLITNFCLIYFRYLSIHGYLSILVCTFGSIANSLNIIVLTRREMRSPTNLILTGLAIADLLVMIDYIPFACYGYILPQLNYSKEELLTYSWAWYVLFHAIFAQILHTTAIWLTVTLAIWRYIAVAHPQKNRLWCNMKTTLIAISSSYVVCPFIAIPIYLSSSIKPSDELLNKNGFPFKGNNSAEARNVTLYRVGPSELALSNESFNNANLWIYSVAIKLIPCLALTILSLRLIFALLEAKRRRKQLTGNSAGMKVIVNGKAVEKSTKNNKALEKEKQTDRTTRMLLAVLLLFLTTEFPQGILGLLSALLGNNFFTQCYVKLGKFNYLLYIN